MDGRGCYTQGFHIAIDTEAESEEEEEVDENNDMDMVRINRNYQKLPSEDKRQVSWISWIRGVW